MSKVPIQVPFFEKKETVDTWIRLKRVMLSYRRYFTVRVERRYEGRFDDPMIDEFGEIEEWCKRSCKFHWSTMCPVKRAGVWEFRVKFADKADAALFKLFWV